MVDEYVRRVFTGLRKPMVLQRGSDLRGEVKISSLEAQAGRKVSIEFSRLECKVFCRGACRGGELVRVTREVEFKIPPGTKSGQRMRLRRQGNHFSGVGQPGDLFCDIIVA